LLVGWVGVGGGVFWVGGCFGVFFFFLVLLVVFFGGGQKVKRLKGKLASVNPPKGVSFLLGVGKGEKKETYSGLTTLKSR